MDDGIEVLQPEGWPAPKGYANGIAARGRTLYVGGQIGWDETGRFVADDLAGQTRQALKNIVAVLQAGGAMPRHLVRLTWYVTDMAAYRASQREMGQVYRDEIGRIYPAMTLVQVLSLAEPRALVEIEATAVMPDVAGTDEDISS
ncbi:MAG TPA: RidA family protein [Stellaceae bacterium]|nr:RidA family protein [Stellaceae bacterium]